MNNALKSSFKTWLQLLLKCFTVLLPFWIVWGYMWARPIAYVDTGVPLYFWNREQTVKNHGESYKVLILGDSMGNASYVPEILGADVMNLALESASPCEAYYILREWLEHNPAPRSVFLTFGDSHLGHWDSYAKTFYSHRFSMAVNLEILQAAQKFNEQSILKVVSLPDLLAYELRLPQKYMAAFLNAGFNQRKGSNRGRQKTAELHAGRYVVSIDEYSEEKLYNSQHFEVAPFHDHYLRETLALCRKYSIKVHFIKIPLAENRTFSESYRKEWNAYWKNLQEEYKELQCAWLDKPYPQYFYFHDGRHFNDRGALRFSKEVRQLFPEDFPQMTAPQPKLGNKQVAAINDDLRRVNKLPWLTEWASEGPYTLLICDRQGGFDKSSYGAKAKLVQSGAKDLKVYALEFHGEAKGLEVHPLKGEQLQVSGAGNAPYTWTASSGCLSVLVIDRQGRQAVTVKNFRLQEEDWVVLK